LTESPVNKYFNLEELEDREKAVTEVYLNADYTVTVGETDGPLCAKASGTWSVSNIHDDKDNNQPTFQMTLSRTYTAGAGSSTSTDMGEFSFTVDRIFRGNLYMVGAKLAVEGSVHANDELGDHEVGYFEMIDVTKEREEFKKQS
jgi:hypothetical protein